MKPFALLTALVLYTTGAWPYVSDAIKTNLATGAQPIPAATYELPAAVPTEVANPSVIKFESDASIYAIDAASGQVLYAQHADQARPIASVTKLMTVLTALDKLHPDEVITVGQLPTYQPEDETMGLKPGQKFKTIDLVKAALIPSDNDAADALGIAASGSLNKFYIAMNAKAAQWDIIGAHFVSASGLIDKNNVVPAAGVAKIAQLALTNSALRDIINTTTDSIRDSTGITYNFTNTNALLATGQFYGIKTGYTEAAGQCFVGLTKIDGHDVITVVLGSQDRFGDTTSLVNWITHNWSWPPLP